MTNEIVNVEQAAAWDGPDGEYWAAHQERFDTSIRPHHARLMAAAAIAPGERVLDVGCGNGATSRDAARAAAAGGSVLAVDLSGPMLARAQQSAEAEGLTTIRFEQGDAQVHPFEPGAFDVAINRFAAGLQPVLMMLADLDEASKAKALDNLRATVAAHETADGVIFRSAAWVVTASQP